MRHVTPRILRPSFRAPGWSRSVTEPGAACDDACRERHARAMEVAAEPHPDANARRWQRVDQELTGLIMQWQSRDAPNEEAIRLWFADRPLRFRFPAEPFVLIEWLVLGFRETPEAQTLGERLLPNERWRSLDLETLARAAVAAPPTLLRVIEADPAWGMLLQPLCPTGSPVRVPDRASACLAHPGGIVGGRLLRVGAWHILRPAGPFVHPSRAPALLAQLDEVLRCHGVPRSAPLPALHAEPEMVSHLLAIHAIG